MRDSYGTYDGRKPEPPYPTEQERREQGMKLEMKQRMEQTDFKKLADEARKAAADLLIASKKFWTRPVPGPAVHGRLIAFADAIDALLAERDAALDCEKDNIEINARLRNERNTLLSKLVKATEALDYYADEKRWPTVAPSPLKARAALDAIKETDANAR